MEALILPYIAINILLPTFIILMDGYDKKWQILVSYIVPLGCILVILIEGFSAAIKTIPENWHKLK